MKQLQLLFSIILVLTTITSSGQRFNGGIFAGGDVSQVDGDTYQGYHKAGVLAGGMVSLRVSPESSFQMEIGYIQKGSRMDSNDYQTYQMKLHYMEIPVLYQYTFAKRMSWETGPAVDILVGSQELSNGFEIPEDHAVKFRPVTLSGIIGISGYLTHHLKANIRVNYSLLSIRDGLGNGYRRVLLEKGQYNNIISFSLYWDFKENENF
ncbi:MAG: porin family protein [Bacteroidota bacterium]|nr:porin family protein [Bacteroidota bacterium]